MPFKDLCEMFLNVDNGLPSPGRFRFKRDGVYLFCETSKQVFGSLLFSVLTTNSFPSNQLPWEAVLRETLSIV